MSTLAETPATTKASRIEYEDFISRDFNGARVEWAEGEIIEMSPVSDSHADVTGFIYSLLRFYAEMKSCGVLRAEPFQMKTGPDLPGRSPDVLFVATEHHQRIRPQFLDGPADLVVEVVSRESRSRDRGEKFYEYAEGGVPEYWIIDPDRQKADFFRNVDGVYHPMAVGEEGVFRSEILNGLWLRVEWLWQKPLPRLVDIYREWGLM